jgi:DeoR/GlpR family transcriptional regulator of sugar metabolism
MVDRSEVNTDDHGPIGAAGAQTERRDWIRDRVRDHGFVRIETIAKELDVSVMTVHRDLDALQAQGWLRKVRGGATALPSAAFHGDVGQRMAAMAEVKGRLANAALGLLVRGQTVMLDESTTCLHVAQRLTEKAPLTVISNFLAAIKLLAGQPGITLIALSGTYLPAYDAFLGLHTAEAAESFRSDVLLMSTTAISNGRCYHQSQETVQVKRALMANAGRRILLVDHTKFAREGLYALAPLTDFDIVIADNALPAFEQKRLRDSGVRLQLA